MKNNLNLRESKGSESPDSKSQIGLCARRIMLRKWSRKHHQRRLPTAAVTKRQEETGG